MNDTVNFERVRLADLIGREPVRAVMPTGHVFEELRAGTGAFKVYDPKGGTYLTHSQAIDYLPTLGEQHLASRAGA